MICIKMIDNELIEDYYYKLIYIDSKLIKENYYNKQIEILEEAHKIEIVLNNIFLTDKKSLLWIILYRFLTLITGIGDGNASCLKPYNYYFTFWTTKEDKIIYVNIDGEMNMHITNQNNKIINVSKRLECKKSYIRKWIFFISFPIIVLTIINVLCGVLLMTAKMKAFIGILLMISLIGEGIWIRYYYKKYKEALKSINN